MRQVPACNHACHGFGQFFVMPITMAVQGAHDRPSTEESGFATCQVLRHAVMKESVEMSATRQNLRSTLLNACIVPALSRERIA